MAVEPRPTGRHWVWVSRPEYYRDEDGNDYPDLDPDYGYVPEGWWSCAPDTRDGDLAVMYRSRERKDISHLIAVRSAAWPLDDPSSDYHGTPVCRGQILAQFKRPLPLAEMRADPVLRGWPALRAGFRKRAFPVPDDVWNRLFELLSVNPGQLHETLLTGDRRFRLEKDLKRWIRGPAQPLARLGYNFIEQQDEFPCGRGRADIVYTERTGIRERWIVVELKRAKVGISAVDQIREYRKYLDDHHRRYLKTQAILIGEEADDRAKTAIRWDRRLRFISVAELQGL